MSALLFQAARATLVTAVFAGALATCVAVFAEAGAALVMMWEGRL